jgi:hypothetical protein
MQGAALPKCMQGACRVPAGCLHGACRVHRPTLAQCKHASTAQDTTVPTRSSTVAVPREAGLLFQQFESTSSSPRGLLHTPGGWHIVELHTCSQLFRPRPPVYTAPTPYINAHTHTMILHTNIPTY